jgi:hypothetical protein
MQSKRIKTHNLSQYIKKNEERKNIRWSLKNGHLKFLHKGEWYNEEFFNALYPIYIYEKYNPKGLLIGTNYLL